MTFMRISEILLIIYIYITHSYICMTTYIWSNLVELPHELVWLVRQSVGLCVIRAHVLKLSNIDIEFVLRIYRSFLSCLSIIIRWQV